MTIDSFAGAARQPMLRFEFTGHCAIITIDRPEARNAINPELAIELERAIDRYEEDENLWVAILTATPPVFCAGADLKAVQAGHGNALMTERGGFAGFVWRAREKPVIAAVDGPALAGGAELVLACDLVVASTASRFGMPEVSRGLIAGAGGVFRLPRKLPTNVAMWCAITAEPLSAEDAYRYGLVNRLCEPGQALHEALGVAALILNNAPLAVRESRRLMLETLYMPESEAWACTTRARHRVLATEDVAEGLRAFVEKRGPVWRAK
jgi:enoyl-CoA hydratase